VRVGTPRKVPMSARLLAAIWAVFEQTSRHATGRSGQLRISFAKSVRGAGDGRSYL
jgi:hypothetical protein